MKLVSNSSSNLPISISKGKIILSNCIGEYKGNEKPSSSQFKSLKLLSSVIKQDRIFFLFDIERGRFDL